MARHDRTRRGPSRAARARRGSWAALAAGLALTAVVLGVLAAQDPAPAAPPARAQASASPAAPSSPTPDVPSPEHLTIADIGVSTDLVRLGLNDDRTVEVPEDAARAGWFSHGPVPGQRGSSVVLGHVDSVDGPAVFHRLGTLRRGDTIDVRRSDGSTARFAVARVATYANEDFPAQAVYAGSPGRPALNLVTCGGEYDAERGGWQSNVVVFAEHVRTTG